MYDFQKANMWKRISAAIFDFIILVILVIGFAWGLSGALNYQKYSDDMQVHRERIEAQFGIDVDISAEEYEALSAEEKEKFLEADKFLRNDPEINRTYSMLFNLTLIIITFSILLGYLFLEFMVPLIFKNGQTLGKKIFGIGVMRSDGVRLSPVVLFIRTVLGKYTIETMIPVLLGIMILFNAMSVTAIFGIALLAVVQLILIITSKARTPLHDKLASTVTVDFASQMIFDTKEELLAYKQKLHAEQSALKER
ncbi:MAG: RDD family protein [Ruminococcaceae bacterium]|nr:RDD family protein [Oscillospiraceae bacterium]